MESAITAIPSLLQRLQGKRKFEWYALCSAIAIQGIVKGYSIGNLKWLMAQAALESDWGKSPLASNYSNFYGMWKPSKRKYFAEGFTSTHDGVQAVKYLVYRSSWQCARDRFAWDAEFSESVLPFKSSPSYGQAVGNRYHGSASYAASVEAVKINHEKEFSFSVWATLLVLPLEVYAITKIFT